MPHSSEKYPVRRQPLTEVRGLGTDEHGQQAEHPRKKRLAATRVPPTLTRAWLEADALRYLNRFDATTSKLSQKLEQRVRTVFGLANHASEWDEVRENIASLIARLSDSGVLNDLRLAEQRVTSLRAKGSSRRAVDARLRVAGLHSHTIDQALRNVDSDPRHADLNAAARLVSRRKLGWCRPDDQRLANKQKDLARLARAGFSHAVSARALAGPLEEV